MDALTRREGSGSGSGTGSFYFKFLPQHTFPQNTNRNTGISKNNNKIWNTNYLWGMYGMGNYFRGELSQ